jgi:hypothetical protein
MFGSSLFCKWSYFIYVIYDKMVKNFTKYQQNEQSPLNLAHWTQRRQRYMTLEIQVLAWDRYQNVEWLNRLKGSKPSHFNNRISNGKTNINKW